MKFNETLHNLCPRFFPFGLLLIAYLIYVTNGKDLLIPCKKSGLCTCIIDDVNDHSQSEFSLWPFNNNDGTPNIKEGYNGWTYAINLCTGFNMKTACKNVSGCQTSSIGGTFPLARGGGPLSFGPYNYNRTTLSVNYTGVTYGTYGRSLVVILTHGVELFNVEELKSTSDNSSQYIVHISSPKFVRHCVNVNNPDKRKGLSVGSILIIAFFVVLILYVVAGILFMKIVSQASGKDLIPNRGFWTSLPGLIKDGFLFCGKKVRCCKGINYQDI